MQTGYALYPTGGKPDGLGPLFVYAGGNTSSKGTGLVGVQIGQEWSVRSLSGNGWGLLPAAEFEAYYLGDTQQGSLTNPTTRLPEHDFIVTFPMNSGVFIANAVISLQTPLPRLHPYIGAGVGNAFVAIDGANSAKSHHRRLGSIILIPVLTLRVGPSRHKRKRAFASILPIVSGHLANTGFSMSKRPIIRSVRLSIPLTSPLPPGTCISVVLIAISEWEALVLVSSSVSS